MIVFYRARDVTLQIREGVRRGLELRLNDSEVQLVCTGEHRRRVEESEGIETKTLRVKTDGTEDDVVIVGVNSDAVILIDDHK